jgi:hypothetical protein
MKKTKNLSRNSAPLLETPLRPFSQLPTSVVFPQSYFQLKEKKRRNKDREKSKNRNCEE